MREGSHARNHYEFLSTHLSKVVENAVAVLLRHLRVNVKGRIAQLRNFLGQQLDTVAAIAKNDGLVDLKLAEQSVQATHLLLLLNESVVLSNTNERKLVHEVDNVRVAKVLFLKGKERE